MMKKIYNVFLLSLLWLMMSTYLSAQTGYTDDCSTITNWGTHTQITVSQGTGSALVEYNTNQKWTGIHYSLPSVVDITSATYVEVDIRTLDLPCILNLYVFNADNSNSVVSLRVNPSDDFVTIRADYNGVGSADLSIVSGLLFTVNGIAFGYNGTLEIDEIRVGTDCQQLANVGGTAAKTYYVNSGSQSFPISDITDASSLTLSGASSLITGASVGAITDGVATVNFDLVTDATGTETATLTAVGTGGFGDNSYNFDITVEDNIAPTIDPIADQKVASGVYQEIKLTGITDGNKSVDQTLTITGSSDNAGVTGAFNVDYSQNSHYAILSYTTTGAATGITVTVTVDDGVTTTDQTFTLNSYSNFNNAPVMDQPQTQSAMIGTGEQTVTLTGIGDGDGAGQNLTITATSSEDAIVQNSSISVDYTQGSTTALLRYTPASIGKTNITVSITDDGDSGTNNGNETTDIVYVTDIIPTPLSGYTVPLDDWGSDSINNIWKVESEGVTQFLSYEVFDGDTCVKIVVNEKTCWTGLWYRTPELNITENPAISFDMYIDNSKNGKSIQTHGYFWDNVGNRNIAGANAQRTTVLPNTWTSVLFDYRGEGDMVTNDGTDVNADRIDSILLNYHPDYGAASQIPKWSGTVYIKNIKWGDHCTLPILNPQCTIDDVPDMAHIVDSAPSAVNFTLTGLSDGDGSTSVSVAVSSSNTSVADPTVGAVQGDGTATMTYTPGTSVGSTTVTLTVSGGSSDNKVIAFDIDLTTDAVGSAVQVDVDLSTTYQTIHGFGTYQFENRPAYASIYAKNLGASAMRVGLIGQQIERVNDNDDPNVLNMDALDYDAFDWDYYQYLKDNGVETFILTSWSPPAWMKDSFSESYNSAGVCYDNTNYSCNHGNMLSFHWYEEFAESMYAVYRMFQEKVGINLKGIGIQNEPGFHEPYPSAILSPDQFPELIKVVGAKFAAEGITDCELYMPEQVFSQGTMITYIDKIQADAVADGYCDVIATHGYAEDGIGAGQPDYQGWVDMWNNAQEAPNPKELWMTETWPQYANYGSAISYAGALHGALSYGNIGLWTSWTIESQLMVRGEPTASFYAVKNFAKFIRPGATRVDVTSDNVDVLATAAMNESADGGNLAVVLINKGSSAVSVDLSVAGGTVPTDYEIYQTNQYRGCEKISTVGVGDLVSLPAMSVTTILGIGAKYTLTVTDGTGDGDYGAGSIVPITANTPPMGQKFKEWTGTSVGSVVDDVLSINTSLTMPANDYTITATYEDLPTYDLTVNSGSASVAGPYEAGTVVSVTADAAPASQVFDEWTGDVQYIENVNLATSNVTMPAADITITATYRSDAIATYTLTLTDATIDGSGATGDFEESDVVPITAADPAQYMRFDAWTGDVSAVADVNDPTTSVTMPAAAVSLTATYTDILYDLKVNLGTGSGQYTFGEVVNITATDHSDSTFLGWIGDVGSLAAVTDVMDLTTTVTMPATSVELTPTYEIITYDITILVVDDGTPISSATVQSGGYGTQTTDASGQVVYNNVEIGTETFGIIASGFPGIKYEIVTVDADKTVTIDLSAASTEELLNSISIYPNPATSLINVVYGSLNVSSISVNDLSGRMMMNKDVNASYQTLLDVSSLTSGVYIISIKTDQGTNRSQLIVE